MENPIVELERTLRIPVAPLTAVSIGKVTNRSTSSGAIPCASVITTTVGAFRSGKTSISISDATYIPPNRSIKVITITTNRLFNE
ncbi:hypothetical protein ES708_21884 [subsurface metagenome]